MSISFYWLTRLYLQFLTVCFCWMGYFSCFFVILEFRIMFENQMKTRKNKTRNSKKSLEIKIKRQINELLFFQTYNTVFYKNVLTHWPNLKTNMNDRNNRTETMSGNKKNDGDVGNVGATVPTRLSFGVKGCVRL